MQSVVDWVVANSTVLLVVAYELWSLIPESVVKSSSVLTFLGSFLRKPQIP